MMTHGSGPQEMEALALKRASFAEGEKVRYRVYRTATDYVAVIAENALMAMKLAQIESPVRIQRDTAMGGVVESGRLAKSDESVALATAPRVNAVQELPIAPPSQIEEASPFVPIGLSDLQRKDTKRVRILSALELAALMGGDAQEAAAPDMHDAPPAPKPPEEVGEKPLTPEEVTDLLGEN